VAFSEKLVFHIIHDTISISIRKRLKVPTILEFFWWNESKLGVLLKYQQAWLMVITEYQSFWIIWNILMPKKISCWLMVDSCQIKSLQNRQNLLNIILYYQLSWFINHRIECHVLCNLQVLFIFFRSKFIFLNSLSFTTVLILICTTTGTVLFYSEKGKKMYEVYCGKIKGII